MAANEMHKFNSKVGDAPPQYNDGIYPSVASIPEQNHQQPQPQVMMIHTPQSVVFGPHPMRVTCPSCHQTTVSEIQYESNMKTHLIATILCVTTLCCCIPYMVDSCKSANHLCKHCGAYLGTYGN